MRQLLPVLADTIDAYDIYRPLDPHAPLLRVNMVTSVDGSATDEHGRTSGLGLQGDHEAFRALRALADAILVGAGTVRAEGYGPHRLRGDLRDRRAADGRAGPAPIVVVSRSLDLDFSAPLFHAADAPTMVVTCQAAPADRQREAQRVGRLLVAGQTEVDLAAAVARLQGDLGLPCLLCEGGPTLNDALFAAGLVDELCLTLTPRLIGNGPAILQSLPHPADLALTGLCEQDGELYARYALPGPASRGSEQA